MNKDGMKYVSLMFGLLSVTTASTAFADYMNVPIYPGAIGVCIVSTMGSIFFAVAYFGFFGSDIS